jgi:hypothetical protein
MIFAGGAKERGLLCGLFEWTDADQVAVILSGFDEGVIH